MISHQLSSEQLLGLSEQDKKDIANATKFVASGLAGMAGILVGMGTFVSHPKFGLPLLAASTANYRKLRGRNLRKSKYGTKTQKVFKFSKFGPGSQASIMQELEEQLRDDEERVAEYEKSVSKVSAAEFAGIEQVYDRITAEKPGLIKRTIGDTFFGGISMKMDDVAMAMNTDWDTKLKEQKKLAIVEISDNLQYDYEKALGELATFSPKVESKREEVSSNEVKGNEETVFTLWDLKGKDEIIDHSIVDVMLSKKTMDIESFDISDKANMSEITRLVEANLFSAGILKKGEKVEDKIPNIEDEIKTRAQKLAKEEKLPVTTEGTDTETAKDTSTGEEQDDTKKGLTLVEQVLLQNTIKEYISANKVSSKSEIKIDEIMKLFEKKKQEMGGSSTGEQQKSVEDVISSLRERKNVRQEKKGASIEDIKEILLQAATKRDKEVVPVAGTTNPDGTKTMEVKTKDQFAKSYAEDEFISSIRAGNSGIEGVQLSEEQSSRVVELLLMQKKMKKLNQQAMALKMVPVTETALERAAMSMKIPDGSATVDRTRNGDMEYVPTKKRKEDMTYGPVNDIINIINKK